METYKETIKTITERNGETHTNEKEILHKIRQWDELTDDEKREQIKKYSEDIYEMYQNELYEDYKYELENIKTDFKNISFEDIYLDSNSQGGWIDRIVGFKMYDEITIYGETIYINDVYFTIHRYIDEEDFTIDLDNYYIETDKLKKIMNTKKFIKWYKEKNEEVKEWIQRINEAASYLLKNEYNCPSMLSIPEEKEWLDSYFSVIDFEDTEVLKDINY